MRKTAWQSSSGSIVSEFVTVQRSLILNNFLNFVNDRTNSGMQSKKEAEQEFIMCDTIVISKRFTENRRNLLAKNSDRPLGECQTLELFPAGTKTSFRFSSPLFKGTGADPEGSRYAVLGSRPYWLYGFEMGANEKGLFIGNEAEGSRMPAETEEGILGMDLLRFALEACETAQEAIRFLAALLKEYGQNANASRLFDRRYENSFILCDPKECWVMETAGRSWAAKKINGFAAVSNCYTIRTDFDLCSEDLEETVRQNRWLHPEEPLDFAKAVTKPALRQINSVPRMNRMNKMLIRLLAVHAPEKLIDKAKQEAESDSGDDMKNYWNQLAEVGCRFYPEEIPYVLSDHFEDEINNWRFSSLGGENVSICMHANTPDGAQTAASMVMTTIKELGMKFFWAPAPPCTSVYIPVWWISPGPDGKVPFPKLPEVMSRGGEFYDRKSLWWVMERLVSLFSVDEERFTDSVDGMLYPLTDLAEQKGQEAQKAAEKLINSGKREEAQKLLDNCTREIAETLFKEAGGLCEEISGEIKKAGGLYGPRKELLLEYAERVRMPL